METDDKELWERLTVVEQSTKSAHHRLDSLDRLTESVHILATETKAMREDVSRVDEIEKRPTKRYETVVGAIITVLVGAVIGYVVKMLGF